MIETKSRNHATMVHLHFIAEEWELRKTGDGDSRNYSINKVKYKMFYYLIFSDTNVEFRNKTLTKFVNTSGYI